MTEGDNTYHWLKLCVEALRDVRFKRFEHGYYSNRKKVVGYWIDLDCNDNWLMIQCPGRMDVPTREEIAKGLLASGASIKEADNYWNDSGDPGYYATVNTEKVSSKYYIGRWILVQTSNARKTFYPRDISSRVS